MSNDLDTFLKGYIDEYLSKYLISKDLRPIINSCRILSISQQGNWSQIVFIVPIVGNTQPIHLIDTLYPSGLSLYRDISIEDSFESIEESILEFIEGYLPTFNHLLIHYSLDFIIEHLLKETDFVETEINVPLLFKDDRPHYHHLCVTPPLGKLYELLER